MLHKMRLQDEPFFMIKSGKKDIEMRLYDEKRSLIKIGDEIVFSRYGCDESASETLICRVTRLHRFPSFADLYAALPATRLGYTKESAPDASYLDMQKYYSPEEQARYGVVGIEIKLIQG